MHREGAPIPPTPNRSGYTRGRSGDDLVRRERAVEQETAPEPTIGSWWGGGGCDAAQRSEM